MEAGAEDLRASRVFGFRQFEEASILKRFWAFPPEIILSLPNLSQAEVSIPVNKVHVLEVTIAILGPTSLWPRCNQLVHINPCIALSS